MRRMLMVGLVLVVTAGCTGSANVDQEREAVLALDREWSQTTKDLDKFMSYFAPDATAYPQGMPVQRGADVIRTTFGEMSKAPGFSITWTPDKAEVAASGDVAYTTGSYQMMMGGTAEKGKYVTVWRKQQGGDWKVVEDIFNSDTAAPPSQHVMVPPSAITFMDGPPGLPAGAQFAVVSGDPSQPQPFVIRARVPAGYRIAAHWHPTAENLTILSGTVALGMGEQFDESGLMDLGPGGYATMPAEMRHYFLARSAATFQVHGMGPFAITYVNPADDPRK